jgi:hypothetical protein
MQYSVYEEKTLIAFVETARSRLTHQKPSLVGFIGGRDVDSFLDKVRNALQDDVYRSATKNKKKSRFVHTQKRRSTGTERIAPPAGRLSITAFLKNTPLRVPY